MAMRRPGSTVIGLTIFALVVGFVIGLLAGDFAQAAGASPPSFDSNEYVWLVSVDYASAGDLSKAAERLSLMQGGNRQLATLVRRVARQAESRHDVAGVILLTDLANALAGDIAVAKETASAVVSEAPTPVATRVPLLPLAHRAAQQAPREWVGIPSSAGSTDVPAGPRQSTPSASIAAGRGVLTVDLSPADFRISLVRQLTACENGGNHHLFILVLDRQGFGIPNVPVEIAWASGRYVDATGKKVENIPTLGIDANTTSGYLNFPMFHGSYRTRVLQGSSDQSDWLTVDIPHDELCVRTDNPVGNSTFHYSYLIVFRKAR